MQIKAQRYYGTRCVQACGCCGWDSGNRNDGGCGDVAAPGGEEEVMPSVQARTPEDCGLNIFGPPAPTPVKGVPFSDPDAGLPDAERLAKYERAEKEGEVRYAPGWSA